MSMRTLDELREKFFKELDEVARKEEMSPGDFEAIHKLTDTIKNIDKICKLEDDEYSFGDGGWEARGMYSNRGSDYNDGGSSYANRRGTHYVRGHYSRGDMNSNRGGSRGRYSRNDSKEYMMGQLEEMMENVDNNKVREAIQRCMNTMENL